MTLALYLDDCAYSKPLRERLIAAGHRVTVPVEAGIAKQGDPVHLAYAVREGLILVTKNCKDFLALHDELIKNGGSHPGLFFVYQDNDSTRDMSDADIVRAVARVEEIEGGAGFADRIVHLNSYRW